LRINFQETSIVTNPKRPFAVSNSVAERNNQYNQTRHGINSTAVKQGIKLSRSYLRETLDSTEHRETAGVRQRTRERCDDGITLPSGFILSLLRTSGPSELGTELQLWDSVKQRGVRLMQQSRQNGRQHRTACIKSHLKTLTCRPPRRLTVEEQRVWNIHLTFL